MNKAPDFAYFTERLLSPEWRLSNLYYIKDKAGEKVLFKPNWAQKELLKNPHNQEIVLKCRQVGVTTLFVIVALDNCLFTPNFKAGIVCDSLESSQAIFKDKVRYAYENLPDWMRLLLPCKRENVRTLDFSNGSSISVSTSFRSGTCQSVHISEFGPICFNTPKLAQETVTGTLNTVGTGQRITIESTAMGRSGFFWEFCKTAQDHKASGKPLGPLDMRFHFFPWWKHPDYVLYSPCPIPKEKQEYFERIERSEKMKLSEYQKYWYIKKEEVQRDHMLVEYPSTTEEAWFVSNEALYYHKEIRQIRQAGQITKIPYNPSLLVHTAWDLGYHDFNVIAFFQISPSGQIRFIDCEIGNNESLTHWVRIVKEKGYNLGTWFFPHDIRITEYGSGQSRLEILDSLGVKGIPLGMQKVEDGIEAVRSTLSQCFFDEEKCSKFLTYIEGYRKIYNEKFGYFTGPLHDDNSHAADCLRYSIQAASILKDTRGMTAAEVYATKRKEDNRFGPIFGP